MAINFTISDTFKAFTIIYDPNIQSKQLLWNMNVTVITGYEGYLWRAFEFQDKK